MSPRDFHKQAQVGEPWRTHLYASTRNNRDCSNTWQLTQLTDLQ